jgi:carboxypeptidase family protein
MWRTTAAVLLGAVTLGGQAQPARDKPPATTGTGTVAGRVLAADTGDPIRKARVAAEADVATVPPVFTDADGRFTIAGLAPARYTLAATRPGYARTMFGAQQADAPAGRIDVADGARVAGVELRMSKSAAISGRVVDESGEAVTVANVTAEILSSGRNGPQTRVVANVATNDLGEYRLSGLSAGSFLVGVRSMASRLLPGAVPPELFTSGEFGLLNTFFDASGTMFRSEFSGSRVLRVYYPGGVAIERAQAITVAAGEEQSAIDFTVRPTEPRLTRAPEAPQSSSDSRGTKTLGSVSGRILGSDGRPLGRARVRMGPGGSAFGARVGFTGDDGVYEFSKVPAGAYKVGASKSGYLTLEFGQKRPNGRGETLWLDEGRSLEHVDILLPRTCTIAGHIVDENGDPVEGARVRILQSRFVSGRRRLVDVLGRTSTSRSRLSRPRVSRDASSTRAGSRGPAP